jgi:hypothetical protein
MNTTKHAKPVARRGLELSTMTCDNGNRENGSKIGATIPGFNT